MRDITACLTSKTDDYKTPTQIMETFKKHHYQDLFKYKTQKTNLKKCIMMKNYLSIHHLAN